LIGLGRIASTIDDEVQGRPSILLPYAHMACYREIPAVEVVAGADPFAEQRDAFRLRWGIERLYADYREMLDREKPDIVSVCTTAATCSTWSATWPAARPAGSSARWRATRRRPGTRT